MPTYDYLCACCGETFEVFQSIKAARLKKCPDENCGGKVERLMGTGAGIIFKGGGFYETDYRSENYKSGEKQAADAVKKATEKKTESKESKGSKDTKKADPKKPAAKKKAKK